MCIATCIHTCVLYSKATPTIVVLNISNMFPVYCYCMLCLLCLFVLPSYHLYFRLLISFIVLVI